MTQYINKSALVAEIERRMTPECGYTLNKLLDYIDTLEVKEVQEEPVSEDLEEAIGQSFIYHDNHGDDFRSDKQIETAYRYGFESGAEWQKEQMLAKAINGDITFDYYGDDDKTYGCIAHDSFCLEDMGLKDKDKVKIVVIK